MANPDDSWLGTSWVGEGLKWTGQKSFDAFGSLIAGVGATETGNATKLAAGNKGRWEKAGAAPEKGATIKSIQEEDKRQQKAFADAETTMNGAASVAATAATLPMGGWGATLVKIGSGVAPSMALHVDTVVRGQAPPRSINDALIPAWVPLFGGDKHYQNGATPLNYNEIKLADDKKKLNQLSKIPGQELTLADLDRDGNKILNQDDVRLIKEKLADDELATRLFNDLRNNGITFENQPLPAPAAAVTTVSPAASGKPDFWSGSIGEILSRIVSWIGDQFGAVYEWGKEVLNGSASVATTNTTSTSATTGYSTSSADAPNSGLPNLKPPVRAAGK